jgi:hypothetical protein
MRTEAQIVDEPAIENGERVNRIVDPKEWQTRHRCLYHLLQKLLMVFQIEIWEEIFFDNKN